VTAPRDPFAGHTPGPWRVGDAKVTVFGPPNGNPSPETIASIRKGANAALIAAAPDLLRERDAARALVAELAGALDIVTEAYKQISVAKHDPCESSCCAVAVARAALAKVRA